MMKLRPLLTNRSLLCNYTFTRTLFLYVVVSLSSKSWIIYGIFVRKNKCFKILRQILYLFFFYLVFIFLTKVFILKMRPLFNVFVVREYPLRYTLINAILIILKQFLIFFHLYKISKINFFIYRVNILVNFKIFNYAFPGFTLMTRDLKFFDFLEIYKCYLMFLQKILQKYYVNVREILCRLLFFY